MYKLTRPILGATVLIAAALITAAIAYPFATNQFPSHSVHGAAPLPISLIASSSAPQPASSTSTRITWSPPVVTEFVGSNGSTLLPISFTANAPLQNVKIEAVPTLAPFVTLQPSNLASIPAGQLQQIQMTIAVPPTAAIGTYDGTVHLRVGTTTLPQTLKLTVVVSHLGATVQIPGNFEANLDVLRLDGPLLLNNFNNQYEYGGFVPTAGAEITITSSPLPQLPLSSLISYELSDAVITSMRSLPVAGTSCTEVFYSDAYGQNTTYSNITAYCPHNTTLFKIFLTYRAGDPSATQFLSAFQQVLNTIQFTL